MSYQEFLSFERRGAVGIVRLARPEKLNTISAPFYEAMIELQQTEIVGDHDLRAIALLADGRHFSAGIDLNYAKAVIGKPGRSLYGVYHWQQAYRFWSECNLPVVVGIQGACMGTAIELITACDIRIAADNAKFSLREVDVGISTDLGGTTRLTKLIGPGMTKLLAMTCEDIDAQEAARIRLVERVVPLGELEQTTLAYAEKLAAKPPIAVQMCKKCINIATDAGTSVGLLAEEIQGIYTVSTKDKAEAAAAMLEKRIEEKKQAILNAYYSPQTGSFIGDAQGANSFAVDIGLGGERAFNNTKKKYDAADAFDTGIFGTDILTRVLFERGCADTAFRLLTSTGKGSFYNMKKQGATTIWENWDGERSHSHPMFGAVTRYLFSFILGITQEKNSAGYEKIVIAPQIPDGLNRASGHITTVRGEIAVSFIKTEREMDFYVTVPQKAWFTYGSDCEYELWEGENHIHIDFEE